MLTRLVCLAIGYVFGLFQTGYFYSKKKEFDLRAHGSGNTGMTNTVRTMGWKAGLIVLLGDLFKCVFAVLLVHFIYKDVSIVPIDILELYAAAGAILGHDFPFFLHFKGGKGMACTAGLCFAVNIMIVIPAAIVFFVPVVLTRYVSLGSILVSIALPIISAVYIHMGILTLTGAAAKEFVILMCCIAALNIFQHRANIGRLLSGTENTFSSKKA